MRPRFAIIGCGSRAQMYLAALLGEHAAHGELVALCDSNPGRLALAQARAREAGHEVPGYGPDHFLAMLAEQRVERLIVTVPDRLHAHYMLLAMEHGCDIVTEKPITIDAASCRAILATRRRTGRAITVCFNYRYSPVRTLFKQVLMSGIIGHVKGGTFEWLLDTHHGADYFRRWHRGRQNSGGLFVHKATHHFDLLNWWLGARPARVRAGGGRVFYRPETAVSLGFADRGPRCHGCPAFARCGFRLDIASDPKLRALYLDQEAHDLYLRDRCVFDAETDIEDSMHAVLDYEGGIGISYRLHAFAPREGYRVVFDGTRGRAELLNIERSHVREDGSLVEPELAQTNRIVVQPHFQPAYELALPEARGTHGGGDKVMLGELFRGGSNDQYRRIATEEAGVLSAIVGIAANLSVARETPVAISELLDDLPDGNPTPSPFGPAQPWQVFERERYGFLAGAVPAMP